MCDILVSGAIRLDIRSDPFQYIPNDILLWLTKSDIHTFIDDNKISVRNGQLEKLLRTLEGESNSAFKFR